MVRSENEITGGLDVEASSRYVLQIAGIYTLITWLPDFAQTLVRTLIYGSWQHPQVATLQRFYENWSVLIAPAFGTLMGMILLFRVNGIIRLVRLARPMTNVKDELTNNN